MGKIREYESLREFVGIMYSQKGKFTAIESTLNCDGLDQPKQPGRMYSSR